MVDEACLEQGGAWFKTNCANPRVTVLIHAQNQGGATLTGCRHAIGSGAEAAVKLDGDGQRDPALILRIAVPPLAGRPCRLCQGQSLPSPGLRP